MFGALADRREARLAGRCFHLKTRYRLPMLFNLLRSKIVFACSGSDPRRPTSDSQSPKPKKLINRMRFVPGRSCVPLLHPVFPLVSSTSRWSSLARLMTAVEIAIAVAHALPPLPPRGDG